MEIIKRVKFLSCSQKRNAKIYNILEKDNALLVLLDLFMISKRKNVIGVSNMNSFMKIMIITLIQHVPAVLKEQLEVMKMNVSLVKEDEFINPLKRVINV